MTCYLVIVGARTETFLLRQRLEASGSELDTDVEPSLEHRQLFPADDAVACITQNGCSCPCLTAFSSPRSAARTVVDLASGFRGALAQAAVRFSGIRVLVVQSQHRETLPRVERSTTSLARLLRSQRLLPNELLDVTL